MRGAGAVWASNVAARRGSSKPSLCHHDGLVSSLENVGNIDFNYAQSAIYTPCDFPFARDGIAAETTENVEMVTVADLNLATLRWARAEGLVPNLHDRRLDLYRTRWRRPRE